MNPNWEGHCQILFIWNVDHKTNPGWFWEAENSSCEACGVKCHGATTLAWCCSWFSTKRMDGGKNWSDGHGYELKYQIISEVKGAETEVQWVISTGDQWWEEALTEFFVSATLCLLSLLEHSWRLPGKPPSQHHEEDFIYQVKEDP